MTDLTEDHEKCTKQPAQNARKNVKYRSNQLKAGLFIAEIASLNTRNTRGVRASK